MDEAQKELVGFLNDWRMRNDLRASEMVSHLLESAVRFAPTKDETRLKELHDEWVFHEATKN